MFPDGEIRFETPSGRLDYKPGQDRCRIGECVSGDAEPGALVVVLYRKVAIFARMQTEISHVRNPLRDEVVVGCPEDPQAGIIRPPDGGDDHILAW